MTDRKIDPQMNVHECPNCLRIIKSHCRLETCKSCRVWMVSKIDNETQAMMEGLFDDFLRNTDVSKRLTFKVKRNNEPMNEKEECVTCGDEACACHDVCSCCKNWKAICSCEEDANDIAQEMEKGLDDGT